VEKRSDDFWRGYELAIERAAEVSSEAADHLQRLMEEDLNRDPADSDV
jgi:hypothetical protein